MHSLKQIKHTILSFFYFLSEKMFPSSFKSGKEIPIIINNFNRLSTLRLLIESLEKRNYVNIYIIDNHSTYPPLLEYYKGLPYKVFYLKDNLGFKALWKSGLSKLFCKDYYIYTDSDVIPIEECPSDFIEYFFTILRKYKYARKVGFSLRIDDLPDKFRNKNEVIEWEKRFYSSFNKDGLYKAPIDTTFALYRPRVGLSRSRYVESYRTPYPYQACHLPWYLDSNNLDEEEMYYIEHCSKTTAWSTKMKNDSKLKNR